MEAKPTDLNHIVIFQNAVVGREHFAISSGNSDVVSGITNSGNGLNVIPVAMGFDHTSHAQCAAEFK